MKELIKKTCKLVNAQPVEGDTEIKKSETGNILKSDTVENNNISDAAQVLKPTKIDDSEKENNDNFHIKEKKQNIKAIENAKQKEHKEIEKPQSSCNYEFVKIQDAFAIVHDDVIKSEDSERVNIQEANTIIYHEPVKTENNPQEETFKEFSMSDVLSDINEKIDKDQMQDEDFDKFITTEDAMKNINNPPANNVTDVSTKITAKSDLANLQWRCKSCDYIYKDNCSLKVHILENHQNNYIK